MQRLRARLDFCSACAEHAFTLNFLSVCAWSFFRAFASVCPVAARRGGAQMGFFRVNCKHRLLHFLKNPLKKRFVTDRGVHCAKMNPQNKSLKA